MSCVHLKKLYELCAKEDLKISGADLVRIVCRQCGEQEVCPSALMNEMNDKADDAPAESSANTPSSHVSPRPES
ncbi:MAG: hypothetical protein R3C53_13180 [Pirellulaceae bacterium]